MTTEILMEKVSEDKREPYWCIAAPNVQRVWSSSSLSTFAECPRKYQYSYVEGWSNTGGSLDFQFGTAWHRLIEWYWRGRFKFVSHDEMLNLLVSDELAFKLPSPTRTNQAGKTPLSLARSLVWYFEQYDHNAEMESIIMLNGQPAIELHFSFMAGLDSPDGEPYWLQGYIDQLRNFANAYAVWDLKTTSGTPSDHYAKRFDIDVQNHVYTLAASFLTNEKYSMFIVDAMGVGVTYTDFLRIPVPLTSSELDEALLDIQAWIRSAENCAEMNYWPKNTKACNFCDFSGICNKAPEVRQRFLQSDFKLERREFVGRREEEKEQGSE